MTDPFPPPDTDPTDGVPEVAGITEITDLAGTDHLPSDGLVLGDLGTPGAGDTSFLGLDDPSGPAAFYTHSGTPCG